MTRLDEIEARLAEPPAAQDEFLQTGREWRAIYGPQTPFPPNYGIAVQMASDLSRARTDLAALVAVVKAVRTKAEGWAALAPDDDWGEDIAQTIVADAGRAILATLDAALSEPEQP